MSTPPLQFSSKSHKAADAAGTPSPESRQHPESGDGAGSRMSERVQALRFDKNEALNGSPRRRWWLVVVAVVLAVVAYRYLKPALETFFPDPPEVDVVAVTYERPLDIVLDTTGYLLAHTVVNVSSRVPGTVVELNVVEGQQVKKGDLLMRLEEDQYRADLDQARAAVAAAEARLEEQRKGSREEDIQKAQAALAQAEAHRDLTAKDLERARQLEGTIAPAEHDRIEAAHRQAEANVVQFTQALELLEKGPRAERIAASVAEVDQAKAMIAKAEFFHHGTNILSPIDGTVLERTVELGEMIRLEALNTNLCRIADLSRLEVEIEIQERDLAQIRLGQPCLVTTEAYPDRTYRGRLDWLAPVFNRQRGIRRAKVTILKPDEKLAPDMNCRVQILNVPPLEKPGELAFIPKEALHREGEETIVYVLEDNNMARLRRVSTGETIGDQVAVRKGLHEGEQVVIAHDTPLKDKQEVRPRSQDNAGER